ncbi:MAG: hypothetical protein HDT24_04160 [Ruminococcus sp.]|nr:hypothetical protein [Ruminococcus sp.]
MNKKRFGKILSFLTSAAMTMTFAAPAAVFAEANARNEIHIVSQTDFAEFVKSCVLDSNTIGKKYYLECDIELPYDFKPIPTFCGMFEGNGHTVSGLNIAESGSDTGLFRYIEKEGTVKDLNVHGRVAPSGSASECGGIAGVNRGKILSCSFSGMVSGKERCGGITGVNEKTGLIAGCKTTGLVQARHYTGGIAGENSGIIVYCENESSVNVMAFDDSMDLDNINIEDIYSTENATEITDEGGIVGYSSGNVQNCTNRGNVGYIHVGYNVGGIAGRQEGYISGCENYGVINGRKDTGGIVGQAEPHISLLFSERSMSKLRTQLEELNALIDRTINDADADSSAISANWDEICGELENARQISDEFLDKTDDIINADIDSINELSSRISDFIDMAAPAAESLEEASDSMSEAFGNLKNSVQLISDSLQTADDGMKTLFPILQDLSDAVDSFKQASASLDHSFGELQNSVGDEQGMESALENLGHSIQGMSSAAGNLSGTAASLADALSEFANDPSIDMEKQEIERQLRRLSDAADRFAERIRNSGLSWGIGGAFDEYTIGVYLQEIANILSDQSMVDIFESLSEITEAFTNIMSSTAAKNLDEQLKNVSAELGQDLKNLQGSGEQLSGSVGEVTGQVNVSGLFGFIRYLRESNQDLNGATASADSIISRITEAWDYFDIASAQLVAAVWFAEDCTENARTSAEQIKDAFSQTVDILDYFSGKEKIEFVGADDEIIAVRNRLSTALGNIVGLGDEFGDNTGSAMSTVAENFRLINSKTSEISDTILDIVDEINETSADISDYTDDISSEDSAGQSDGKVERCKNYGEVNGDLCAGGIAGSMAVEYDFDPEGDIERIGTRSANFIYQSKTVVRDSVNYGEVISKKGRAGGIAGEMSTGCLIDCVGFGDVKSTDGDYSGGIAGKSEAAIQRCSAKCRVSGKDFVGGIAGTAHDMIDCKSFVVIEEGTERIGAVAGYSDFEGEITNNTFVDGGIGAVDGISYSGIAYPVPYDKLIALENVPKEFRTLELTFISEDEIVKVVPVEYGESLTSAEIPGVPDKGGNFGKWEEFNYENITFSAEINAVYEKFITALESAEKRDSGLPIFVAEGNFTSSDNILSAENISSEGLESWSITLPNDGAGSHKVRFLPSIKPSKAVLTVTENGVQRIAETEIDGKYLVVEVSGNSAVLTVSERDYTVLIIAAASAAAAAVIIILIIIIRKRNKNNPKNSAAKDKNKENVLA